MNTRPLVCPYCGKPLPDYKALHNEIVAEMPEEANRNFAIQHACRAWVQITPDYTNALLWVKPTPKTPGVRSWTKTVEEMIARKGNR